MSYSDKLNELVVEGINNLELWIKTVKRNLETKLEFGKLTPQENYVYEYVTAYHAILHNVNNTTKNDTKKDTKKDSKSINKNDTKNDTKNKLVKSVETAMNENDILREWAPCVTESDMMEYDAEEYDAEEYDYAEENTERKGNEDDDCLFDADQKRLEAIMQERRKLLKNESEVRESKLEVNTKETNAKDTETKLENKVDELKTPKASKKENVAKNEVKESIAPDRFGSVINNVEGHMTVDEMEQKAPVITALLRINNDQREQLYTNIFLTAKSNVLSHVKEDEADFDNLVCKEADRLLKVYMDTH